MTANFSSDTQSDPAKGGEIKINQDGKPTSFPANSYQAHADVVLDFSKGNPNDGTWEGMVFLVKQADLGKDVPIPGNGAHFQATLNGEAFSAVEGTIRINKDLIGQTYYGTLSAKTIGSNGTRIVLEEGIFSLKY